jgi:hypothetical protein
VGRLILCMRMTKTNIFLGRECNRSQIFRGEENCESGVRGPGAIAGVGWN